ncbi:hypothetical protein H5410_030213 [Solanum commersonii]|uniref:Uncharacterized protein n=1 Tax=Solanum commersonii TaxID=4109 RepID=A0A9J5YDN5_SOLCO|nr:hypothetical protein H5410_030213 [Solanum commersonii]
MTRSVSSKLGTNKNKMEGQLKRHKLQLKSRISRTPSQYVRSAIDVSIKTQGIVQQLLSVVSPAPRHNYQLSLEMCSSISNFK